MGIWTFTKKDKNAIHALRLLKLNSPWVFHVEFWIRFHILISILPLFFQRKSSSVCSSIVRIPADVYTFIFVCDLINFFVLMFGFSTFSVSKNNIFFGNQIFFPKKSNSRFFLQIKYLIVYLIAITIWRRRWKLFERRSNSYSVFGNIIGSIYVIDYWSSALSPAKHERQNNISHHFGDRCARLAVSFYALVPRKAITRRHLAADAILFHKMCILLAIGLSNTLWLSKASFGKFRK